MLAWVDKFEHSAPQDLPSRNIRPWLSNGLIIDFLLYGVVYMSSMLGLIDAHTERKGFFVLTFGSKIAYCAAFVFIRADEYHKTLTDVLRKVSVSNVGMLAAHEKIDTDGEFFTEASRRLSEVVPCELVEIRGCGGQGLVCGWQILQLARE